jgi:Fe-Mn family superoxide dismutase
MLFTRRQMLVAAGVGVAALAAVPRLLRADVDKKSPFELPPLPYEYHALEPHIDAETMKIHHDLHHKAYVDNLNAALMGQPDLQKLSLEEILRNIDKVPADIRQKVINNGGGHANHTLFWTVMANDKKGGGGQPKGDLAKAIDAAFGSFDKFQTALTNAATSQFGSGWGWLVVDKDKKLQVIASPNQDSPLMKGLTPILGLDVWEHAYYLKYRNKRADYVKAWWNVVNWDNVADRYTAATK